jgi:radical SAM protein with 4Fe4S-binding SPASM domain
MNNIFCSAPWTSIFIDTDGDVKPCCSAMIPFGNIRKNTVDKIINGPIHLEVKQALLNGVKHRHCSQCYELEERLGTSTRMWFNQYTPIDAPNLNDFLLQMIDIRWSNNCNLRCLYCNAHSSSSIAELQGISTKLSVRAWQDEIMQLVKDNILTIREVYMLGGEPFLIKENLELLDQLTDQRITLFTNLSLDNTNNKIYKKLLTNPNVDWGVSIEQTGKKFEYVRNGASWEVVKSNLIELNKQGKRCIFHLLYSLYSALDLYDTIAELQKYGKISLNLLTDRDCLIVTNHSAEIQKLAVEQIDKIIADTNMFRLLDDANQDILHLWHRTLQQPAIDKNKAKEFIKFQKENPGPHQFEDLWPDVWQLLNIKL